MYPTYLVVMCRTDLPADPFWRELGLPSPYCWDVDMFFDYALEVDGKYLEEAKRIYWECLHPSVVLPVRIDGHFSAVPVKDLVIYGLKGCKIEVFTPNGFKPILAFNIRKYRGDIYEIVTEYRRTILLTPEHKVPVFDGVNDRIIEVDKLEKHDNVKLYSLSELPVDIEFNEEKFSFTPTLASIIGLLISDGCKVQWYATKYGRRYYTMHTLIFSYDDNIREFVKKVSKELTFAYARAKTPHMLRLGKAMYGLIKELDGDLPYSPEKYIPYKLLFCEREIILNLLKGLYSGDGCIKREASKSNVIDYATTSFVLAQQLYYILLYLGFKNVRIAIEKEKNGKYIYRIQLSGKDNILKFFREIGFIQKNKMDYLRKIIEKEAFTKSCKEKKIVKIDHIKRIPYSGMVIDIAIEKPHTYYAGLGGILIHNCYWRWKHHYKHHHPFPEFYICDSEERECVPIPLTEKAREWLIRYVVYSGTIRHVGVARIPERHGVPLVNRFETTSYNLNSIIDRIIGV